MVPFVEARPVYYKGDEPGLGSRKEIKAAI
jgi:hypothetical protein